MKCGAPAGARAPARPTTVPSDSTGITEPGLLDDPDSTRAVTPGAARRLSGADAPAGPLSPGQPFGSRYHIVKLLGLGGMGAVYQAWDAELGVVVALKVIRPEVAADPSAATMLERRFKQELLLARQVTHKNVVRIHELGEIDDIKFITMPFIAGDDLAKILKQEERLPIERTMRIARGIVSGLEAAHAAGVVHRDLKPANLLVGKNGDVMIMDFGVARSTGGPEPGTEGVVRAGAEGFAAERTVAGAVVGTIEYMAPEQARAEPVDQRADIYAFGLIVYDMLVGRHRARSAGSAFAELTARMVAAPPPPRAIRSDIPDSLNRIVARCIEPKAENRIQTTRELVAALDRLDDRGHLLPVVRRVTQRLTTGVLAVVLGLLGLTWWLARIPAPDAPRAATSVLIADFENATGDPLFDGSLEQVLSVGMEGASFITAYPRSDAQRIGRTLDRSVLNEESARLVANRENIDVVLVGSIVNEGSGYRLTLRALNPAPGASDRALAVAREQARSKPEVLTAIGSLVSSIRRELGDTESADTMAADSVSASSIEAVKAYSQAQELQVAGLKPEALAAYQRAVALDPKFGLAYSGAAITAFELGLDRDADQYWQTALTLMDRMSERERLRVMGAYYLGVARDFRNATITFEELAKNYPADRSGQGNLALAYFWSLDMRKALEAGRRLVEQTPNDALNRSNYALYAMYASDFATAEKETARVLEQQPSFSVAHLPIAVAALARSDVAAARAAYARMAGTPEPGPSMATLGLADIAMYEGDFAAAEALLLPALATDRAAGNIAGLAAKSIALAEAREALGQREQAVATARETLTIGSRRPSTFSAGMILLRNGGDADARAVADNLSQQPPPQMRAYGKVLEGRLAMKARRPVDAIDAFLAAVKLADMWIARFELGVAYIEAGHYAEGRAELLRCQERRGEAAALFLDENPTFRYLAPLPYWLGRAQQGMGMSQPAAANFKTYLDLRGTRGARDPLIADARKRASALQ